jgi:hypothetical protein
MSTKNQKKAAPSKTVTYLLVAGRRKKFLTLNPDQVNVNLEIDKQLARMAGK